MGNIILLDKKSPASECISMSNALTSVFINVLGLSGSQLAKTDDEKKLIVWLLEKNQSGVGIGTVGFYICEMPWNIKNFKQNQEFLLSVIDGIRNRLGWETLHYEPNETLLFPCIAQFEKLIQQMTAELVDLQAGKEWLVAANIDDPILNGFPQCPKHCVFLTLFGCQICTD